LKCFAGEDELGRRNGNRRDTGLLERGSEQPCAETFAEGREPVEKLGSGGDVTVRGNFVKKIAAERIEFVSDAIAVFDGKREIAQNVVMKVKNGLGFRTRALVLAVREGLRDGEQPIGDPLHRGDDYNDLGRLCHGADETSGMKHALSAEQRRPAKLKCGD
jgi:hypothetical protein